MNGWVVLRRARIILLVFLVLICLAWAALFAIFLSHEWSFSSLPQKILVIIFLVLDVFTAIILYLMAVIHVCPWWDVARMFVILVAHTGTSVLFTHYKPNFSCRGYDTETLCKDLIFTIFIGCWVFSGTTLCFAIALGVMAFIPRPVDPEAALESLPLARTEGNVLPSNTDWLKAGSPTNERRKTSLPPIRTGLPVVTYNNGDEFPESSSPDRNTLNSIRREANPLQPPHLWQGFESKNSTQSNKNRTRGETISTRNAPGGSTSIGSVPHRADSFSSQKYSSYSPTSRRVPIHPRAPMSRLAEGGKNTPAAKVWPNRASTFPKPRQDALQPIPLRNSRSLKIMPHVRATEYLPRVFSAPSDNSVLTPPWDDSQPTYPDHARTMTPDVYSFHPAPENVHTVVVGPPPYGLLPSVPSPRVERFGDLSAFWGPSDTSSGNNAPFATGGPNAPLVSRVSRPRRTAQRPGEGTAHYAGMPPPVKKVRFLRRSSGGQVLDQTQWWRLVRGAASKP